MYTVDKVLSNSLPFWPKLKRWKGFRKFLGFEETIWTRLVYDRESRQLVQALNPETLSVLEISGSVWKTFGFHQYRQVDYPEFDICQDILSEQFDLIIAEHLFEHLLYPYRAAKNVLQMLKPGGHLLMVTPFLYRVHPCPYDCTRWTETGLKYFLADCGFSLEATKTGSWGNRACLKSTFSKEFRLYNRFLHSLNHEWEYPIVVWGLAQKPVNCHHL